MKKRRFCTFRQCNSRLFKQSDMSLTNLKVKVPNSDKTRPDIPKRCVECLEVKNSSQMNWRVFVNVSGGNHFKIINLFGA